MALLVVSSISCTLFVAIFLFRRLCFTRSPPPLSAESPTSVVIVGAGSLGMCTAYNLAKRRYRSTRIVVIDALCGPMRSTSAHNTGCLLISKLPPEAQDLGNYCLKSWKDLATDAEFCKATGYRAHCLFNVVDPGSSTVDDSDFPAWSRLESGWTTTIVPPDGHSGTITPTSLGRWLYSECLTLGVKFCFDAEIVSANLAPTGAIKSIAYQQKGRERIEVPCQQLVIAAGPWCSQVIATAFPSSTVSLNMITVAGDWIIFRNPRPVSKKELGSLFFNEIVNEKLEFTARNDNTIWATGRTNTEAHLPRVKESETPSEDQIHALRSYASRFLADASKTIEMGRSFRPIRASGLPIMAEVPIDKLSSIVSRSCARSSGVFICTGHGHSGITLGMGSGKIIAQLLNDEKPAVDLTKFGFD